MRSDAGLPFPANLERDTFIERMVRKDRAVVMAALAAIVMLCLAWLLFGPAMPAMEGMPDMAEPMGLTLRTFAWLAPMWVAMMIGMMTPGAAPMLLLFARLQRVGRPDVNPAAAILVFAAGYGLVWTGFSLAAALLQAFLSEQAWLGMAMRLDTPSARAAVLITAGMFELTPLKSRCLEKCRSPVHFLAEHGSQGLAAAFRTGVHHGLFCIGCCAALMGVLFVAGVMNPLAIGGLAVLVLAQKLAPAAWRLDLLTGVALVAAGIVLLIWG
jgi:predicted metal-binding membrane protein